MVLELMPVNYYEQTDHRIVSNQKNITVSLELHIVKVFHEVVENLIKLCEESVLVNNFYCKIAIVAIC